MSFALQDLVCVGAAVGVRVLPSATRPILKCLRRSHAKRDLFAMRIVFKWSGSTYVAGRTSVVMHVLPFAIAFVPYAGLFRLVSVSMSLSARREIKKRLQLVNNSFE